MRVKITIICPVVLILFLAGCAREQDYLEVVREQQAAWNDVADVLETIKDKDSMTAAKNDFVTRMEVCEALAQKARALPTPSADFVKKHDQKVFLLNRAVDRARAEVKRIHKNVPDGAAFLRQFQSQHPGLLSAVQP